MTSDKKIQPLNATARYQGVDEALAEKAAAAMVDLDSDQWGKHSQKIIGFKNELSLPSGENYTQISKAHKSIVSWYTARGFTQEEAEKIVHVFIIETVNEAVEQSPPSKNAKRVGCNDIENVHRAVDHIQTLSEGPKLTLSKPMAAAIAATVAFAVAVAFFANNAAGEENNVSNLVAQPALEPR